MKHTKEPWNEGKRGPNGCPVIGARGLLIAQIAGNGEQGEANAKRILLCVNKCKNLTDEALEKNLIDRGVRYLWDEYEEASCSLDDDMETSVWEDES